jgi:hypothetical protein
MPGAGGRAQIAGVDQQDEGPQLSQLKIGRPSLSRWAVRFTRRDVVMNRRRRRGDGWIVVGSWSGCIDRLGSRPSEVGRAHRSTAFLGSGFGSRLATSTAFRPALRFVRPRLQCCSDRMTLKARVKAAVLSSMSRPISPKAPKSSSCPSIPETGSDEARAARAGAIERPPFFRRPRVGDLNGTGFVGGLIPREDGSP